MRGNLPGGPTGPFAPEIPEKHARLFYLRNVRVFSRDSKATTDVVVLILAPSRAISGGLFAPVPYAPTDPF